MNPALLLSLMLHTLPGHNPYLAQLARHAEGFRPGQWVTYELRGGEGRTSYWRMAVVGEERDSRGREAFWIEIEVGAHPELAAPMAQLRMLLAPGAGMTADGISRLFLAQGFDMPVEVAPDAIGAFVPREERPAAVRTPVLRTGAQASLLTPGGTVKAVPVDVLEQGRVVQRLWMSPQVPVLHVARIEVPLLGQTMDVHGWGEDARPRMRLPPVQAPTLHLEGNPGGTGNGDGESANP